jgi:hypothetical protein
MGERPDQIERHIQHQRDVLGDNISELEDKVKSAFDWRSQFAERPATLLGLAFVGGALVAAILPSTSSITARVTSRRRSFNDARRSPYTNRETAHPAEASAPTPSYANAYSSAPSASTTNAPSGSPMKSSETWDNLKNAAIGVATARIAEFIEDLVPGFSEQYKKAASGQPATPFSSVPSSAGNQRGPSEKSWQKPNGGSDYASHS